MTNDIILQEFLETVSLEGFEEILDYNVSLEDHFELSNRESIYNIVEKQSEYRTNGFQDMVNASTKYFLENHKSFEEFVEELAYEDFVQPYVNTGVYNVLVATTIDNIAGLMDSYPISIEDYGLEHTLLYKQIEKLTVSNEGLVNGATAKAISSITHTNPAKIVNAKSPHEVKPVVEKALDTAVKKNDWFLVRAIKGFWTRLVNAYKNVKGGLSYMFGGKVKKDAIKNAKDLELANANLTKSHAEIKNLKNLDKQNNAKIANYQNQVDELHNARNNLQLEKFKVDKELRDVTQKANKRLDMLKRNYIEKNRAANAPKVSKYSDGQLAHRSLGRHREKNNKKFSGYFRRLELQKKGINTKELYKPGEKYIYESPVVNEFNHNISRKSWNIAKRLNRDLNRQAIARQEMLKKSGKDIKNDKVLNSINEKFRKTYIDANNKLIAKHKPKNKFEKDAKRQLDTLSLAKKHNIPTDNYLGDFRPHANSFYHRTGKYEPLPLENGKLKTPEWKKNPKKR